MGETPHQPNQPQPDQPYAGQPPAAQPPAAQPPAAPYAGQPPAAPYAAPQPAAPYAGQPYAGQPYAGQPYGGQPPAGQPYGGQTQAGQPQPGAYAGQPYVQGQPQPGQYPGQGYPPAPYGPYGGQQPPAPRGPVKTSLTGPVTLTSIGVALLVVTAVIAVFVVRTFVSIVPFGVLDSHGNPGTASIITASAPGTGTATLEPGYYDLYLIVPAGEHDAFLDGSARLTSEDGTEILGVSPGVNGSSTLGGSSAFTVAGFTVEESGEYTLTVPAAVSAPDARVVLVEGHDLAGFMSGVFGTVGGVFLAIALGVVGFGLTVGGVIWWVVRARARRRVAAGPQPA